MVRSFKLALQAARREGVQTEVDAHVALSGGDAVREHRSAVCRYA